MQRETCLQTCLQTLSAKGCRCLCIELHVSFNQITRLLFYTRSSDFMSLSVRLLVSFHILYQSMSMQHASFLQTCLPTLSGKGCTCLCIWMYVSFIRLHQMKCLIWLDLSFQYIINLICVHVHSPSLCMQRFSRLAHRRIWPLSVQVVTMCVSFLLWIITALGNYYCWAACVLNWYLRLKI